MNDEPVSSPGSCPVPIAKHETIQLAHGAGGQLSRDLVRDLFVRYFDNAALNRLEDQATVEVGGQRLTFTTDSYIVDPIFFPGGDIGELAVNGTVNDLSMNGSRPLYLSAGFIIEEGFPIQDLERVTASMQRAANAAGVLLVTGDTKVVNRGKGDKIFINTAGIGIIEHDFAIASDRIQPGDAIIVSGPIGNHGMAVLSQREGLAFESPIESDTASLNGLVQVMLAAAGKAVHALRDPTRGGVAATLNELAAASNVGIQIREEWIPVDGPVAGGCELLGLDPLYVANEGKLVAAVAAVDSEKLLQAMRAHPLGRRAVVIGSVSGRPGRVTLHTRLGTERIVDMPVGEQLPRIC